MLNLIFGQIDIGVHFVNNVTELDANVQPFTCVQDG